VKICSVVYPGGLLVAVKRAVLLVLRWGCKLGDGQSYCSFSKWSPLAATQAVKCLMKFATALLMCSCDSFFQMVCRATFCSSVVLGFGLEFMVLFQNDKSYKLPKVVNRDNGNLRAEPPSRSIGRSQAGRGKGVREALPYSPRGDSSTVHIWRVWGPSFYSINPGQLACSHFCVSLGTLRNDSCLSWNSIILSLSYVFQQNVVINKFYVLSFNSWWNINKSLIIHTQQTTHARVRQTF